MLNGKRDVDLMYYATQRGEGVSHMDFDGINMKEGAAAAPQTVPFETFLIGILTVPSDSVDWTFIKELLLVNTAECNEGGYAQ